MAVRYESDPGAPRGPVMARLHELAARARALWLLRSATLGRGVRATGWLSVLNRGELRIGRGVTFLGGMIPTRLSVRPGAQADIGEESLFNYGSVIDVATRLVIGKRCMLGSMVHLRCGGRGLVLGDDVWIAHSAVVESGVTIGAGSVVAAGCIVTKDVPPGSLAAGVPARFLSLELLDVRERSPRRSPPGSGLDLA